MIYLFQAISFLAYLPIIQKLAYFPNLPGLDAHIGSSSVDRKLDQVSLFLVQCGFFVCQTLAFH